MERFGPAGFEQGLILSTRRGGVQRESPSPCRRAFAAEISGLGPRTPGGVAWPLGPAIK